MFCQRRQSGESTAWQQRARSSGPSRSSKAEAAAAIAAAGAPSGARGKSPSRRRPDSEMPKNGARASASHWENSVRARGRSNAFSACPRAIAAAMRDPPAAGTQAR